MASLLAAQKRARDNSRRSDQTWYVVYEPEEGDGSSDMGYYPTSAHGLETYWGGIASNNIIRAYIAGQES